MRQPEIDLWCPGAVSSSIALRPSGQLFKAIVAVTVRLELDAERPAVLRDDYLEDPLHISMEELIHWPLVEELVKRPDGLRIKLPKVDARLRVHRIQGPREPLQDLPFEVEGLALARDRAVADVGIRAEVTISDAEAKLVALVGIALGGAAIHWPSRDQVVAERALSRSHLYATLPREATSGAARPVVPRPSAPPRRGTRPPPPPRRTPASATQASAPPPAEATPERPVEVITLDAEDAITLDPDASVTQIDVPLPSPGAPPEPSPPPTAVAPPTAPPHHGAAPSTVREDPLRAVSPQERAPHAGTPHAGTLHAGTPHAGTPHGMVVPHATTPHAIPAPQGPAVAPPRDATLASLHGTVVPSPGPDEGLFGTVVIGAGDRPPPSQRMALTLENKTPLAVWTVPWKLKGKHSLTVVAKATCDIPTGGGAVRLRDTTDAPRGDVFHDGDPAGTLVYPSDHALLKHRADVLLVGHVYAPGGRASYATLSFTFGRGDNRFERQLSVFGAREWRDGVPSRPDLFRSVPLLYERAFGGPGFDKNPVGVGFGKSHRGRFVPSLEDPQELLSRRGDERRPACTAPISPSWEGRYRRVGQSWRGRLEQTWDELPDDFNWEFFQSAPRPQQLDYLNGDEPFEIHGARPNDEPLSGSLPALRPACTAITTSGSRPLVMPSTPS